MTDSESIPSTTSAESEFDPQAVADRAGVETDQRTYVHEDADHCEADAAGRVIVGVTNERGEALLLVDHERSIALLPNATVDAGESWRAAGRHAVADETGVEVSLDRPARVREIEHTTERSETPHTETVHVVFEASAQGEADPRVPEDSPFEVGWFETLPFDVSAAHPAQGDALEDVQRVLR
ncbi:NUDIX hydrolase [Halapricum salinum]|uniref:NUDIX hydrolase n=1 Tax=Halapricum salinum TaxID=1457250 RepID=A0A4D6HBN1_9EURY|nr:NUDIX hydrolase [Halapricum salinum]QCC51349.1 NUDIX hydrolase [Halapricum salinum]